MAAGCRCARQVRLPGGHLFPLRENNSNEREFVHNSVNAVCLRAVHI
jgi:hypothetical protein